MDAAPDDSMSVQQILHLLTSTDLLVGVTLAHQLPGGLARISIRKSAPPPGSRPQAHYWWEARAGSGEQVWEAPGDQAYPTAEAAYEAAVQAVSGPLTGEETASET